MPLGRYSFLMWWPAVLYVSPLTSWGDNLRRTTPSPSRTLPLSPRKSDWIYGHHLHLPELKQHCVVTAPGPMNQTLLTTRRVTDTRWISSGAERPLGVGGKCRPAAEIGSGITSTPSCDETAATASHKYGNSPSEGILHNQRRLKNTFVFSLTCFFIVSQ